MKELIRSWIQGEPKEVKYVPSNDSRYEVYVEQGGRFVRIKTKEEILIPPAAVYVEDTDIDLLVPRDVTVRAFTVPDEHGFCCLNPFLSGRWVPKQDLIVEVGNATDEAVSIEEGGTVLCLEADGAVFKEGKIT